MTPHIWVFFGRKDDKYVVTSYFLWGCSKCGAKVTTETAYQKDESLANSYSPALRDLELYEVEADCLTHLVNSVHNR